MDEPDISPYQARLYGAVIYGHDRARQKASRLLRVVWRSRRFWQERALKASAERRVAADVAEAIDDSHRATNRRLAEVVESCTHWQARALEAGRLLDLVGALCEAEQRRAGIVDAFVRTDILLYALYGEGPPPPGWPEVRMAAERILREAA
ncbi:hypothetical protein [Nocardia thailandica]|uniref:hypothetical protein n=1 Tax=Nocardia thailandica TaxID=257275 RepID=UPI0002FD8C1B|nr:hypothetical protein [Nocardia thailandica]